MSDMRTALLTTLFIAQLAAAQTTQPAEREVLLSDIVQLTSGFARAGEAYFSPDAKWIIFQASPERDAHYQMYVAALQREKGRIVGIDLPKRVSPDGARNTCGYFSPDGKSILFGSTAGKEKPDEAAGGYQREGRSYVWSFPTGMEIFVADPWREGNVAARPLTDNDVYDAECAFSPDGK